MTPYLADLKRLALAATWKSRDDQFLQSKVDEHRRAVAELCDEMTPERILQILAVIEAAKALSTACESIGHGASENINDQGGCPVCVRVFEFDAALARLEKES
jgi:hypothetical protein